MPSPHPSLPDRPGLPARRIAFGIATVALAVLGFLAGCASVSQRALAWQAQLGPVPAAPLTPLELHEQLRLTALLILENAPCRRRALPMTPTHITIHSTQNPTGDAWAHAKALQNGKLRGGRRTGYLFWHFTVQQDAVVQHLPTNIAGEHADLDGPGNRFSIGIEMAEHHGNDLAATIDRTAKLTASLMHHHGIPLRNVVPHFHWPREGYQPPNKNCPHFLLEGGKPGPTWDWFKQRVEAHYRRLVVSAS